MRVIIEPVPAPTTDAPRSSLARRLMWFAGLSLAGVLSTAVAAYGLRALLFWR
jgi:hypothetical protein